MAVNKNVTGRAGGAAISVEVLGLQEALKRWAASDPMFNKEIRASSVKLIQEIVTEVQTAATYAPNPRQATEAARGFRARPDRIPVIRLNGAGNFVSQSRPNRKRSKKVTRGDVFFGAEFGSDQYKQFPERTPKLGGGNRGNFFWPTIEGMGDTISKRYLEAIDRILGNLERM